MATLQREVIHTMSTIREVLFKVERITFDDTSEDGMTSDVVFASTSFDRAMQWARDNCETMYVQIASYADADDFGFTWLGEIAPCLLWRHVYDVTNGECIMTNTTAFEERRANDLAEWHDECAAAASWIA
jgi:agmatine/peptidylarginine deiminase